MFAYARSVTTRVLLQVWVVAVLLHGSAFKNQEKKMNNPALDNNAEVFSWKA